MFVKIDKTNIILKNLQVNNYWLKNEVDRQYQNH